MDVHSILLRNATILTPKGQGDDSIVVLKNHSLLVEGNQIARIAPDIEPPWVWTEVVDCTGKLISPGFVDTHHHLWQTQAKGRHADHTLLGYMAPGNLVSYAFDPNDIFWGQLGGCLEALEAGTTTVVDHAHLSYSPEHNNAALSATISSGIRSVYCYTPIGRVKKWKPEFEMDQDLMPDWIWKHMGELCARQSLGDGRVTMGFGFDFFFLPQETIVDAFKRVRSMGVKTITTHYIKSHFGASTVDVLETYGLLEKDMLFSHATPFDDSDATKVRRVGAAVSSTPQTELQMGHGWPVWFQDNCTEFASLGVDCHSTNTASMVEQMRVGLQAERARRNVTVLENDKVPLKVQVNAQQAFQLATIRGARAIKMGDQLGSLEVGKLADIVVFDMLSPGMICAAEEDPIAAIILHSSVSDIDAVLVDGQFKKKHGRLLSTTLDLGLSPDLKLSKTEVEWHDVAKELLKSREKILRTDQESGAEDVDAALESMLQMWAFQQDKILR